MIKPDITPEAIDRLIESIKVSAVDNYLDAIAALRAQAARIAELEAMAQQYLTDVDDRHDAIASARNDAMRQFAVLVRAEWELQGLEKMNQFLREVAEGGVTTTQVGIMNPQVLPNTLSEAQREITRLRKELDAAQKLAMFDGQDLVAVYVAGRSNALDEAANTADQHYAQGDTGTPGHHIRALKKESSHVTPCLANRQANA